MEGKMIVFHTKYWHHVYYQGQTGLNILGVIGVTYAAQRSDGILLADQIPDVIQTLQTAEHRLPLATETVAFANRCFPLIELCRAAIANHSDITWHNTAPSLTDMPSERITTP